MSDFAIRVENLGKKYTIAHQQPEQYALRYALTRGLKRWGKSLLGQNKNTDFATQEEFWALQDVSFEVKQGDRIGIIGRNGAGKSTLLKILSRITEPSTGCIKINGRVASLLEVGTGFHPELTGRENIYLNGSILGMSKAEINKKFDEIIAFAEIEKFLDTPVKRYSSGMYVRLAFAVAAHLEPEILIVDEVLAVGDLSFQKKCLGKMEDVAHREGRTVLLVSHNMETINLLCNNAIYINDGIIRKQGISTKVVEQYLSDFFRNHTDSLERLRYPGMGQKIRFLDIQLISNEGAYIPVGSPLEFEFVVFSEQDFSNLSIGSSIYTISGSCVGTLFTKDTFSIRGGEKLTLKLVIHQHNLAPGSYYASLAIGEGDYNSYRKDFDIILGRPSFQIVPTNQGEQKISFWHTNWGNIVFYNTHLEVLFDD